MSNRKITISALIVSCALLLAGCQPAQTPAGSSTAGEGKLFTEPTEISIVVGSHTSWPYNENWIMWKYFQEATGATLKVQAIPNESMNTKISLMLASPETLPDLLHTISKSANVDPNALDGAFIAIDDHLDEMPNFTKYFDSLPERAERGAVKPAQIRRREDLLPASDGDGEAAKPAGVAVPQGYL